MSSALWSEQLDLMVRARTSLIWIRSTEEARVETLLKQAASRLQHQLDLEFHRWPSGNSQFRRHGEPSADGRSSVAA